MDRMTELVNAFDEILLRMGGIEGTSDDGLKTFCAKEMLDKVQETGGIWPKIAQNLAMRPDVVKDSYCRNKLKETQSGEKNAGKEATVNYLIEQQVKLNLTSEHQAVPILDLFEYDRFIAAGSVGQVDRYRLKDPSVEPLVNVFKSTLPDDWTGERD